MYRLGETEKTAASVISGKWKVTKILYIPKDLPNPPYSTQLPRRLLSVPAIWSIRWLGEFLLQLLRFFRGRCAFNLSTRRQNENRPNLGPQSKYDISVLPRRLQKYSRLAIALVLNITYFILLLLFFLGQSEPLCLWLVVLDLLFPQDVCSLMFSWLFFSVFLYPLMILRVNRPSALQTRSGSTSTNENPPPLYIAYNIRFFKHSPWLCIFTLSIRCPFFDLGTRRIYCGPHK